MQDYATVLRVLVSLFIVLSIRNAFRKRERASLRSVAVLVLGDIGRSPRMMYHAESFANAHFQTYLVGYAGSKPIPSLERLNVELVHLAETPSTFKRLPFLLLAPLKIAVQIITVLSALLYHIPHPPEYIIVQNPPSIPTLALVQLVCWLRGSKLIIDWHNLGYSILALRLGEKHVLVRVAREFEKYFGRIARIHLFVTQAMRDHLVKDWDLQGVKVVLHDRPPSYFKRAEDFEIHDLFHKLAPSLSSPSLQKFLPRYGTPRSTPFTRLAHQSVSYGALSELSDPSSPGSTFPALRSDRPALLVSSTSWTPDEDFSILLDALEVYEKHARRANELTARGDDDSDIDEEKKINSLPKLLAIVTGKGPQKEYYMNEILRREEEQGWRWVRCRSLWLEAEDYPVLLGSADLGVCLHSSSSNLDLPMKVVDMFGCGLPVCALDFPCLSELVKDRQNGYTFKTADELSHQLSDLLRGFPKAPRLAELRESFDRCMSSSKHSHKRRSVREGHALESGTAETGWCSWSENWNRVVKPLILKDVEREETFSL